MSMIITLRARFISGKIVQEITVTEEEFDQLQAEWIKRVIPADHDYRTHHSDFREACVIAKNNAIAECDVSYWQHQIDVLDKLAVPG